MSDPCVDAGERADECAVLAGRQRRNATYPTKCCGGYGRARARRLGVAREGIGGIRIEPIRYAVEQINQSAFLRIIKMKVGRDERRLRRMEYDAPAHNIGTGGDRFAIAFDPVWRRHGIGVCRQENTIRPHLTLSAPAGATRRRPAA
jgi:hypothetical protein